MMGAGNLERMDGEVRIFQASDSSLSDDVSGSKRRRRMVMARSGETSLDRAGRYVAEAEARVAQQTALVARLHEQGHDMAQAETLLAEFESSLADMRQYRHTLQIVLDADLTPSAWSGR